MLLVALACAAGAVLADAIVVDGVAYKNVYIRESDSRYYIQLPREGRSFSVSKDRVAPSDVFINPDRDAREALLREWKENRDKRRAAQPPPPDPKKDPRRYLRLDARPTPPEPTLRSPAPVAPQTMSPLIPMEAAGAAVPRPQNDGVLAAPRQPPGPRAPSVFPAAPIQQLPAQPTSQYSPMLRPQEPTEDRGIRERMQGVDEEGVPKLVLKGSQEKDPARERYILERTLEERARIAEEQRHQEMAYTQFLWGQYAAANPMLADPFGFHPPDAPWGEQDRPPLQSYGSYPQQQPMTQQQQPQASWPTTPQPQAYGQQAPPETTPGATPSSQQPQAYGQQPYPETSPGATSSPQESQAYGQQPHPETTPGAPTAPLQASTPQTPSGVPQPLAPQPSPAPATP